MLNLCPYKTALVAFSPIIIPVIIESFYSFLTLLRTIGEVIILYLL